MKHRLRNVQFLTHTHSLLTVTRRRVQQVVIIPARLELYSLLFSLLYGPRDALEPVLGNFLFNSKDKIR